MSSRPRPRVTATLGFKTRCIPVLTDGARNIQTKIAADVQRFPAPIPTAQALFELITALEDAQPAVHSGTKGAASTRNNMARALVTGLNQSVAYVQGVSDLDPDNAVAIIVGAGMKVRALPEFPKPHVTLTNATPVGTVVLRANVALLTGGTRRAVSYSWQYNVDGENWLNLPVTPVGSTTIAGLAPKTTLTARVAVTLSHQSMSDWSPASTLIVA